MPVGTFLRRRAVEPLPEALSVGANYGVTVVNDAPAAAWQLAFFILSPAGQEILASYGFTAAGAL